SDNRNASPSPRMLVALAPLPWTRIMAPAASSSGGPPCATGCPECGSISFIAHLRDQRIRGIAVAIHLAAISWCDSGIAAHWWINRLLRVATPFSGENDHSGSGKLRPALLQFIASHHQSVDDGAAVPEHDRRLGGGPPSADVAPRSDDRDRGST